MKKKRRRLFFIIIVILCVFYCCGPKKYRFSQKLNQINAIDIVEGMTELDAGLGNFENIVVLASIPEEAWDRFLADFKAIECKSYIGDPVYWLGGKIIRITYKDGGIELISECTGFYHRFDEEGIGDFKSKFFDDEQFEQLIENYLREFSVEDHEESR